MRFLVILTGALLSFHVSVSPAQRPADLPSLMPPEGRLARLNQLLLQLDLRPLQSFSQSELHDEVCFLRSWINLSASKESPEDKSAKKDDCVEKDESAKKDGTEDWPTLEKASYPTFLERLGRSTTNKFELIQQSNSVVVQSGTTSLPAFNPTPMLFRYTGSSTRSELIPSVSDVAAQAKTLSDAGDKLRHATYTICKSPPGKKLLDCILRTGLPNRIGRVVAGEKDSFIYGQNPEIQQGISVAGTQAATNNYSVSGQVDLDPKGLFLTGTDLKTALTAATAYGVEKDFREDVHRRCNDKKQTLQDAELLIKQGVRAHSPGWETSRRSSYPLPSPGSTIPFATTLISLSKAASSWLPPYPPRDFRTSSLRLTYRS